MPTPNKLNEIAENLNEPLWDLIPRLMREEKRPQKVAARLDVYPNTIINWLKNHKWQHIDGEWVPPMETQFSK